MGKSDQLIEYIVRDVIGFHMDEYEVDMPTAMDQFYNSEIFEKLQDTETGLYLSGSAYVYEIFLDELKYGHIIQREI
jgi:hypothetical protein